jgi:hypothetical protein|tara:strand:+ start:722 stop:1969 length:1248 start_codon:yes stop_codon:yes gene_type:complete
MALDTGNYISDFNRDNPTATDLVSEGDDVLRFIKKVLQKTFPMGTDAAGTGTGVGPNQAVQVIIAKSSAPSITGTAAESMGLVWLDTSNNLLKIRNQANDAWITLAVDPETSNSVDVNAGTIDGAVIGGTSAAAITGTTIKADTSLELATGATVTGIDNATLATGSATLLATQGAVKTYVDAQVTAQDLDVISDSGTIDIDLDSESLTVAGGSGLNTSATGSTLTVAGDDATTSAKGVASFSSDNFAVSSGAVTIKDAGVADAELADMPANTVKARNANSTGVPANIAVADTELLIGNGSGFTTATLSGDATMANTGAVSVVKIQGQDVSSTAATNDQYLKYSSAASEWQKVDVLAPDRLTTKGDLLVYNTVDSETRLPVGTNGQVLTANSSATNGVDWQDPVDNAAAMALALGG